LRDIDAPKKPASDADESAPGACVCGCDRARHYYGKTDHYSAGWHARLVNRCDCAKYKKDPKR
jgi:hypothetical protein